MQNLNRLKEEILFAQSVKNFLQVYEEVAIIKIKRIRERVIKSREFIDSLYPTVFEIRNYYLSQAKRNINHKKMPDYRKKNGMTLFVLFTPNDRLIGDIAIKVIDNYLEAVKKNAKAKSLLIGKSGAKHVGLTFKPDYYFDFPDGLDKESNFDMINGLVLQYGNVQIFYPKFVSFVNQIAVEESVTGEAIERFVSDKQDVTDFKFNSNYIFEPSVEEVLNFFEREIFESYMRQKLLETSLSKLGSRIKSLEDAEKNTETVLDRLRKQAFMIDKSAKNSSQLERVAGITLWSDS
jgi:F0F1-type ATP synthase gamma subunit